MDGDKLYIVNPKTGQRGYVDRSELETWAKAGYQPESEAATEDARLQEEYGDSPFQAAAEGAARAVTFGASDATLGQLDEEGFRERRERNRGAALAGEVAGSLLPVGAGGAIGSIGRAAEGAVVGGEAAAAGLGTRVAGAAVRGAAEGAAFGASEGVTQTALSKDPVTWESAAATIGSNALGGAALGAGIGVGVKGLEAAAGAAKAWASRTVGELTAGKAAGAAEAVDRSAFPEFAQLDRKSTREAIGAAREEAKAARAADLEATKAAREAELGNIAKAKDAAAEQAFESAKEFKAVVKDTFLTTDDRELRKLLRGSRLQVMKSLDNPKSFIRQRGSNGLIDGLEKQEDALTKVMGNADEVTAAAEQQKAAILSELPSSYLPGRDKFYLSPENAKLWSSYSGAKLPTGEEAMVINAAELDTFRNAVENGDILPPVLKRFNDAQAMLEQNQKLQATLKELRAPGTSDALASIDRKLEELRADLAPKSAKMQALEAHLADISEDGLGKKLAKHVGGLAGGAVGAVGGFVGAMAGREAGAELGGRVYDRLVRKIQSGTAARAKTIQSTVSEMFAKGASGAAKVAAKATQPIASQTLKSIRYATPEYVDGVLGAANANVSKDPAVNEFRQRARELNAMTAKGPNGKYDVTMPARVALNDRLQGLWAIDPDAANAIEKTHNARVAFLAGKLPRNPAPPYLQAGPDTWEPSKAELAKFARYMEAVEQPEKVVSRLAAGTMTPEDAEALKAVYPETYEQVRGQVMDHMAQLRETLPSSKRLALSIYLDVPLDPALTPEAVSVYQRPIPMPQQPQQGGAAPKQQKPMPQGLVQPTAAQRFSS